MRAMSVSESRYTSLSSWLKETFGEPVRKISIDAGLSCPNRDGTFGHGGCLYCNPRGSGTGAMARRVPVARQVDEAIGFLSKRYRCRKFIAYFQSFTNTHAPLDRLREIYSDALRRPEIVGISVGTRPDCVPGAVLDLIREVAENRLVWLELGLQSVHEQTLRLINRGHGPDAFFDACERSRVRGLKVVAHLILGLPGETVADMVHTARCVADAGVHGVKLHPLYVIRGTELEKLVHAGTYEPLSETDAQEATLAVLRALPRRIVIHRLTSDPHPEELLAPTWMLDRSRVRSGLEQAMERTGFFQAMDCSPE
jgi:uncharacterized protein